MRRASSHARFYKPLVADLRSRLDSVPPDGLWDLPEPDYSDKLEICFSLVVNAGIAYHLSKKDRWAALASRWLEQWVADFQAALAEVLHQLGDARGISRRSTGSVHCLLEPRGRDQLHRPRDLADISNRLAAFVKRSSVGHKMSLTQSVFSVPRCSVC